MPKSTEFGRRITKQKFYENLTVSPALKRIFIERVKKMIEEILQINIPDDITFAFKSIGKIREGDEYLGYRVALSANL